MADRCEGHPWGTCDGCGVDLGGVCCYSPHSLGEYDTLCNECFARMKEEKNKEILEAMAKDRASPRRPL